MCIKSTNSKFKSVDDSTPPGYLKDKVPKNTEITLTEKPRGTSFRPLSNNTPSIPPSCVDSKRKVLLEDKYNG